MAVGVDAAVSSMLERDSFIATSFNRLGEAVGTDPEGDVEESSTLGESCLACDDVGTPVFARLGCFWDSLSEGERERFRVPSVVDSGIVIIIQIMSIQRGGMFFLDVPWKRKARRTMTLEGESVCVCMGGLF